MRHTCKTDPLWCEACAVRRDAELAEEFPELEPYAAEIDRLARRLFPPPDEPLEPWSD